MLVTGDSIPSDVLLLWTCSEPERLFQGHRLLYSWFALILEALSASVIHARCAALCLPVLTVPRLLLPLFSPPFLLSCLFFKFSSHAFIFYRTSHTLPASCEVVLCRISMQNCAALHVLRPVKEVLCYYLPFIQMQLWKSSAPTNRKDHSLNSWLSHGFINFSLTTLLDCIGHSYNVLVGSIMFVVDFPLEVLLPFTLILRYKCAKFTGTTERYQCWLAG